MKVWCFINVYVFQTNGIEFKMWPVFSLVIAILGLFYLQELTLIPAWISNYIHDKMWMKLHINFQTSMVQPLKFGNG